MRIGLVMPGFSESEADWCIPTLRHLVQRLALSHDVRVYSLLYPHQDRRYQAFGAEVCSFGGWHGRRGAQTRAGLACYRRLLVDHAERPFDIIHGFWATMPGLVAVLAARRVGCPSVVSIMGGELEYIPHINYGGWRSFRNRWVIRNSLSRANAVTANSPIATDRAAERTGIAAITMPMGVSRSLFRPPKQPPTADGILILTPASIIPVKGHRLALDAIAAAVSQMSGGPTVRWWCAGEGLLSEALIAEADRLGLGEMIKLLGPVDHEALAETYRSVDLCLFASYFESQCVAAVEAALSGVPVIGPRVGIFPEIVHPDLLFEPGDGAGCAAAIKRAIENIDTYREWAGRGVNKMAETYGIDAVAARFIDLYHRLQGPDRIQI